MRNFAYLLKTCIIVSSMFFALCGIFYLPAGASTTSLTGADTINSAQGVSLEQLEQNYTSRLRAIQHRNEIQAITDEGETESAPDSAAASLNDAVPAAAQEVTAEPLTAGPESVYQWFKNNQDQSPLGLVVSYPDDASLAHQAFTYDQSIAGTVMLLHGDTTGAGRIFDFYANHWDGAGFYTVYHSLDDQGSKIEYVRRMGETALLGMFAVHYYKATQDTRALNLAVNIGKWIKTLPHLNGGVAMGADNFWGNIYSVENNLDYYALLKFLAAEAPNKKDRSRFRSELNNLKDWFRTQAYDPATGLFRRSPTDSTPTAALDSNSWGILSIGIQTLTEDFGIDVDALIARTEETFAVQDFGAFNGDISTAKGFDFSDASNASMAGRGGIKWVEGTNQMITVYAMMRDYYANIDAQKAAHYQSRIEYFLSRNAENTVVDEISTSYVYTDAPGTKVWWDNPYWVASSGPAIGSTAWVYFAETGFNPFDLTPQNSGGDSGTPDKGNGGGKGKNK